MRWLLTGGAGYIGAHVAIELLESGRDVVVLDDLSSGSIERVPKAALFVEGDVKDAETVARVCSKYEIDGVVHLAAKKSVPESVREPMTYFRENVEGVLGLLDGMARADVQRVVYSSSAAVYGEPIGDLVSEDQPTIPTHPYGQTKLIGEWAVAAQGEASRLRNEPFASASLRYFNVAGAGADDLGDDSVESLIPLALRAVSSGSAPEIFGDDYPTPDGTCVRDFVHVIDVARAHVAAARLCETDPNAQATYNVGRGFGSSVREVIGAVNAVTGYEGAIAVGPRRTGDLANVVASTAKIEQELGWKAELSLDEMVASSWSAWPHK